MLSTRFTLNGGLWSNPDAAAAALSCIVRVMPHELQEENCEPTVHDLIEHWAANRLISRREKSLLQYMMEILDADEAKKRAVLETAITKMTERE